MGQVIEHYKRNNIFFPEEKIFHTFIQFMDGLSYIHNELKVIHKDLKPGYLFYCIKIKSKQILKQENMNKEFVYEK